MIFGFFVTFILGSCVCIGITTLLALYVYLFVCDCVFNIEKNKSISNDVSIQRRSSKLDVLKGHESSKQYHSIILISLFISIIYIYCSSYIISIYQLNNNVFCFHRTLSVIYLYLCVI